MFENENKGKIEDLGEFGLIHHLTNGIEVKNTHVGIGDDAALIDTGDKYLTVTTDMLVEGVHFNLMYAPLKHLGFKSVMVNLSDVYAMNAEAKQLTVSLAISSKYTLEAVEELYSGIRMACEQYGVDLIGGDTTSSKSGLVISITALGEVEKGKETLRSTARENDLLVVSGDLGAAYIGLQVLERETQVFKENPEIQPDLTGFDYVLERQLKPEARKDVIGMLKELNIQPTSMIDISDGLASEAIHLAKSSKLGVHIYDEKLPFDPNTLKAIEEFNMNPTTCALNGGEDYELLFTIKQSDFDKLKGHPVLKVIGHMTSTEDDYHLVDKNGGLHELKAQGWDAFLSREKEEKFRKNK